MVWCIESNKLMCIECNLLLCIDKKLLLSGFESKLVTYIEPYVFVCVSWQSCGDVSILSGNFHPSSVRC